MRSERVRFNFVNLNRVPADEHGIYIFWCNSFCVYVGKAEKTTLKARLTGHYNGSHNDDLNMWINSSHELQFEYEVVDNKKAIAVKERKRIRQLWPRTNKQLVKNRR